ncbi:Os10g0160500 [Oryza sativa Japonica Group]|uniref:Os10g0160500 protein n=1 Tax=Oryza sativa subsp. japonica TaxID=39947 RepID=A0A0P0XSH5_ORYSJ|nr:Os10g0160500 [Oryza sativa Japonica Group]
MHKLSLHSLNPNFIGVIVDNSSLRLTALGGEQGKAKPLLANSKTFWNVSSFESPAPKSHPSSSSFLCKQSNPVEHHAPHPSSTSLLRSRSPPPAMVLELQVHPTPSSPPFPPSSRFPHSALAPRLPASSLR